MDDNELTEQAAKSDRPIRVEVVNGGSLSDHITKVVVAAVLTLAIKKGGEMLLDSWDERRKARKAARAERKLKVVKTEE